MAIVDYHLVRSADDWEFRGGSAAFEVAQKLDLMQLFALLNSAMVHEDRNGGCPFLKFVDPIRERAERCDDEVRAKIVLLFPKKSDDADGLDGFAYSESACAHQ